MPLRLDDAELAAMAEQARAIFGVHLTWTPREGTRLNGGPHAPAAYIPDTSRWIVGVVQRWLLHEAGQRASVAETRASLEACEASRDEAIRRAAHGDRALVLVGHEIRDPLAVVVGGAEVLARAGLPLEHAEIVDGLVESARALREITEAVLDHARARTGGVPLHQAGFALGPWLDAATRPLGALAARRGLSWEVALDPDLPPWVYGDATRLRQALHNLAANALKFTRRGGVRVEVRGAGAGRIRVVVSDTGPGLDPADHERIFEPYVQVGERGGGVGLGLSLVREIARAHGGDVGVRSTPGEGATFWFTALAPATSPVEPSKTGPVGRAAARRVLVVDDHRVNRLVLRRVLEIDGHRTGEADTAEAALRLLDDDADWDLVIVDLHLPDGRGDHFLSRLRATRPDLAELPVALWTGDEGPVADHGFVARLRKPIDAYALSRVVRAAPRRGSRAASPGR